ncbi:hypothetical protein TI39_contig4258g00001 [Zymoseptoria brevis]|uniref:Uncharacterized protein n=1 Tax=Zymoseptoria brevis TaxID=1047168 RepID=A0A0F4G8U2_9PEZI|nr:hypothetical protein TI39_contig4258g00001 [Zymoseptoria brevis]
MSIHEAGSDSPPIREPPTIPSLHTEARDEANPTSQSSEGDPARSEVTPESLLMSASSTHSQSKSRHHLGIANWWQEVLAATFMIAAVIASYATLAPYEGRSLPEWPRYITISAILSIYSVVLRLAATLLLTEGLAQLKWRWFNKGGGVPLHDLALHDNATRGPVGSLQLLWRLPLPVTWQWLGCMLIVLVLATGPLTQLVLQYEQCPTLMDQIGRTAGIPRASVFIGQGDYASPAVNSLSRDEQNAIDSGLYNVGSTGPQCSSGNCTFAPYSSIGFCSTCNDISGDVKISMGKELAPAGPSSSAHTRIMWLFTAVRPTVLRDSSPVLGTNYTTYTDGAYKNFTTAGLLNDGNVTMIIGPPNLADDNVTLADCSNNRTWACRGYAAATCGLSPCIREYTANVENGIFQEKVINTWRNVFGNPRRMGDRYVLPTVKKKCLTEQQSSALRAMNYTSNADDTPWLAYHGSEVENSSPDLVDMEKSLLDRQCLYGIDYPFTYGLSAYLSGPNIAGDITGRYSPGGRFLSFAGPPIMLAIYNGGDFSFERTRTVWENISLALTNHIRRNPYKTGGSGSFNASLISANEAAPGLTYTTKTCLQVRWGWLAFPTALAVLTLIFFAGAIFSTGGLTRDVRTWKSSPLPLLFYGCSLSDTPADSQHVDDLNRAAKRTNVGLIRDEEGNMVLRKRGAVIDRDSEI